MAYLANAAPKVVFGGINDLSRRAPVRDPETFAQHTPLLRLFTQTGPEETTYVNNASGGFAGIYGSETLSRRSKYFNTQSLLAETLLAEGNSFFVKRLKPEDAAPPARIILAIDLVRDEIPKVVNQLAGFDYPDQVDDDDPGSPVADEMVEGYRARLVLIDQNSQDVGMQTVRPGSMTGLGGEQSTLYPLFELPASFFGEPGNNLGFRLWVSTVNEQLPYDEAAAQEFKTRMYRAQFMRRDAAGSNPVILRTRTDEDYVDICFRPGAFSRSTDQEYYAGEVLVPAYEDDGFVSGLSRLYSPFSQFFIYQENLEEVQQLFFDNELVVNPAAATTLTDPGEFDVFSGIDIDGYYYQGLLLEGPLDGGVLLGKDATIYAQGGTDGTMNTQTYEALVTRENVNFGELGDQYENVSKYPFGRLYDTGLSMDGKYEMMRTLARRQDLICTFTTFVEAEGRAPTRSEELSRAQALMSRLRGYPESTLYGTPVCRAEIILQTGKLAAGGYNKFVPQVIDYAQRWATYGGAASGILREGFDIDASPNNRIQMLKELNVEFFNERLQSELWATGTTYSLTYDRRSQFYPAIHSVYSDDTSVLISPITVSICTDIMRMIRKVHADFSGNATLTKAQLIERCDNEILRRTDGRYGQRVQIVPETYFTATDDQLGFSWHCKVTVYANNPRTVMIFDLETQRMEELGQ